MASIYKLVNILWIHNSFQRPTQHGLVRSPLTFQESGLANGSCRGRADSHSGDSALSALMVYRKVLIVIPVQTLHGFNSMTLGAGVGWSGIQANHHHWYRVVPLDWSLSWFPNKLSNIKSFVSAEQSSWADDTKVALIFKFSMSTLKLNRHSKHMTNKFV